MAPSHPQPQSQTYNSVNAPPRPMTIDISVVILSWNDKDHLVELLDSLQSTKRSMEIIVVDNASTDGSPELVEAKYPHVILIKNKENLGFPKGNNMGTRASRGKYVYLLNSDIKVLEGCMDALADFMDQNPKVGFCGPRIFNKDLTHQSSCRRNPTLWNNICSASGLASVFRGSKFFSGEHMFYFKGDRQIDVDVLVGCFWVVRRAAIDEFGLLDEGFFIYAEDVDWCKRCWKAGWRVVFFPGQAIHYGGASTTKKGPRSFCPDAAAVSVEVLEKASWQPGSFQHGLHHLQPFEFALGRGFCEIASEQRET